MVATDIREQRPCIQLWPAAGSDLGSRRGGVRATLEPAHRLGVRALRGERALPTGDARRPERGSQCVGTKGPGRLQRLPRHVTDRLPASRGAPRGATRASRCTNRARRSDPRRIRLRLLAPRSVCGPVPSAVRRVAEHHARAPGQGPNGSWLHHGPDTSGPRARHGPGPLRGATTRGASRAIEPYLAVPLPSSRRSLRITNRRLIAWLWGIHGVDRRVHGVERSPAEQHGRDPGSLPERPNRRLHAATANLTPPVSFTSVARSIKASAPSVSVNEIESASRTNASGGSGAVASSAWTASLNRSASAKKSGPSSRRVRTLESMSSAIVHTDVDVRLARRIARQAANLRSRRACDQHQQ